MNKIYCFDFNVFTTRTKTWSKTRQNCLYTEWVYVSYLHINALLLYFKYWTVWGFFLIWMCVSYCCHDHQSLSLATPPLDQQHLQPLSSSAITNCLFVIFHWLSCRVLPGLLTLTLTLTGSGFPVTLTCSVLSLVVWITWYWRIFSLTTLQPSLLVQQTCILPPTNPRQNNRP